MYTWSGMKKISYEEAVKLFTDESNNKEIFLLYDDDSESVVDSLEDIERHNSYCGEFGYEIV